MRRKSAFTLIELLIVIAILGILATAILVAMTTTHTKKARDSVRKADLNAISKAIEAFYFDNGFMYPPVNVSPGAAYTATSEDGDAWIDELTPGEIKTLPIDPKQGSIFTQIAKVFKNYWGRFYVFVGPRNVSANPDDVTVDILNGSDDGMVQPAYSLFQLSVNTHFVGDYTGTPTNAFYLFRNVNIPADATINTAEIRLMAGNHGGSPTTRIFAADESSPNAPADFNGYNNISRTTEYTDWNGPWNNQAINTSANFNNVVQELVCNHSGITNILILHDDNGSSSSYSALQPEDNIFFPAPQLYIEYSPGSGCSGGGGPVGGGGATPCYYYYEVDATRQNYILWACLEFDSDDQIYDKATAFCRDNDLTPFFHPTGVNANYNYCVKS